MSTISAELGSGDELQMREVLEALNDLGDTHGALIEGAMHFNKSVGVDVLDRIMNSRAFSAVSRVTNVLGWDPADATGKRVALVIAKSNVGPIGEAEIYEIEQVATGLFRRNGSEVTVGRLQLVDERSGVDPNSVLARPSAAAEASEAERLLGEMLLDPNGVYDGHSAVNKELAGISERQVANAWKKLGIYKRNIGGLWHWSLDLRALEDHHDEHASLGKCSAHTPLFTLPVTE